MPLDMSELGLNIILVHFKSLWGCLLIDSWSTKLSSMEYLGTKMPPFEPNKSFARWLLSHNCFGPLFLFVEGLLSTGSTPSSFYLLVEMGLPLHLFPAYMW